MSSAKKETKLGIDAKKSEDMASWYTQVRTLANHVFSNYFLF